MVYNQKINFIKILTVNYIQTHACVAVLLPQCLYSSTLKRSLFENIIYNIIYNIQYNKKKMQKKKKR